MFRRSISFVSLLLTALFLLGLGSAGRADTLSAIAETGSTLNPSLYFETDASTKDGLDELDWFYAYSYDANWVFNGNYTSLVVTKDASGFYTATATITGYVDTGSDFYAATATLTWTKKTKSSRTWLTITRDDNGSTLYQDKSAGSKIVEGTVVIAN